MTWEAVVLFQMQVEANTNCTQANPGVRTGRWTTACGEPRERKRKIVQITALHFTYSSFFSQAPFHNEHPRTEHHIQTGTQQKFREVQRQHLA